MATPWLCRRLVAPRNQPNPRGVAARHHNTADDPAPSSRILRPPRSSPKNSASSNNRANNTDGHYLPLNRGFDFSGLTIPFSNHWACDEKQVHLAAPNPAVCFLYRGQRLVQQPIDHRNLSMNFAFAPCPWGGNTDVRVDASRVSI